MSVLASLKLVASKQRKSFDPVLNKRNKLCGKLKEQLELVEAEIAGGVYAPKRFRTVTDSETGERKVIESAKRVRPWFWISDSGRVNLCIKYGAKTLTLDKKGSKNAIELANKSALVETIKALQAAVVAGELDDALAEASAVTRAAFKK